MENDDPLFVRKQIRRQERLERNRHRKELRMSKQLEAIMLNLLPSSLVPGNVGGFNEVCWPFDYTVKFDFGLNPTYGPLTENSVDANGNKIALQSFQVTQEAAFIVGSISRKCWSGTTSGELAPLNVIFRDRQSTRQFMDFPIPIQAIAKKTPPTVWEVPLILLPNAFLDVQLSSWISNPAGQATEGSGRMSFTFHGYRTRVDNIGAVLSTIYGNQ